MLPFASCGRLPADGDNVAIATRRLEAGEVVDCGDRRYRLAHTVLEGHRFVHAPIGAGQPLRSWGLPFGEALRALEPGEYVCNQRMLDTLPQRGVDFALPNAPNFHDRFERLRLDPDTVRTGEQVPPVDAPGTFLGFRRPGRRGVGTRNFVVVLGLTSTDGAAAVAIAQRARAAAEGLGGECEVVAVTHTEGGGRERPRNLDFVLRALAGFVVHANTAAVVVVDHGVGSYRSADLQTWLRAEGYAIDDVPHAFVTDRSFDALVASGEQAVRELLPEAAAATRSEQPLSELKIALQCGGSDAFSGVSGNALAGYVARELIRHGGAANLAETDELIGAESYVLDNVRDVATAQRFVDKIATFEARARGHGASAEGNPSGGNLFRGLYNITLKSLGAARKKAPDVRLDGVLDYGQPIPGGGYWFMDSPGNDIESIAGQVATGCNLILFITGNGSITNFPFVPTLKFVTTTGRFELLANEMDVNAGRYNDGMPMAELGDETFALVRRVASGERTRGESAGHAQVSLWREWRQSEQAGGATPKVAPAPEPDGVPHTLAGAVAPIEVAFEAFVGDRGVACDRVGLVMPTSLCSGEVARMVARHLDERRADRPDAAGPSRYVALVHTEGCGAANADELYLETLRGHLRHPSVQAALLLEHGCEKIHNDAVRGWLRDHDEDTSRFGYASVQLDGGIERVREKVANWFDEHGDDTSFAARREVGTEALRVAMLSVGDVAPADLAALAALAAGLVAAGALVVVPERDALLREAALPVAGRVDGEPVAATLAYGRFAERRGLHVMAAPTADPAEVVTGLGGTGVELMVALVAGRPVAAHPMIPMLQVGRADGADVTIGEHAAGAATDALLQRMSETLSGAYTPHSRRAGHVGFQLTRGDYGISL